MDIVVWPRIFDAKILSEFSPIEILDHDSINTIFEMLPLYERLKLSDGKEIQNISMLHLY